MTAVTRDGLTPTRFGGLSRASEPCLEATRYILLLIVGLCGWGVMSSLEAQSYSNCTTSPWRVDCPWNPALNFNGTSTYCVYRSGPASGGSGSGTGGAGIGGGFFGGGGGGGYSFTPKPKSSDDEVCAPPDPDRVPDPCASIPLRKSKDDCDELQELLCDEPTDEQSEPVASVVNLWGLQYFDKYSDLQIAAPGGWLSINRRYSYGAWRFDSGTEFIRPLPNATGGLSRLDLNGRVFTLLPNNSEGEYVRNLFISEDGYSIQYYPRLCSTGTTVHECPWYVHRMVLTKPDGSWLMFAGKPPTGGVQIATGAGDKTHLYYDRRLVYLDPADPFSQGLEIRRVISGLETEENGAAKVLLYFNYGPRHLKREKHYSSLRSVTTYDPAAVSTPDPKLGQIGVFYEYYPYPTTPEEHEANTSDIRDGLLKTVTTPDGYKSEYFYDDQENLIEKRSFNPENELIDIVSIEYHPTNKTFADAVVTDFMAGSVAGPPKRVASVTDGSGVTKRFSGAYNSNSGGYYSKVSYSNGLAKETWYDAAGKLIQKTLDGQTVYNSVRVGRVERVTSRGNAVTIREYDEAGNKIRETLPSGHSRSWTYADAVREYEIFQGINTDDPWTLPHTGKQNRLTSTTDLLGRKTVYTYNDDLSGDTSPVAAVIKAAPYSATRSVRTVETSADGQLSRERLKYYDTLDRLVLEIDPLGYQTAYEYKGKTTLVEFARRLDVPGDGGVPFLLYSQTFDALGNLESRTDASGIPTYFDYDTNGRLLTRTDAHDVSTVYTYAKGHLVQIESGRIGNPGDADYKPGRVTRYTHDGNGRRTAEIRVDAQGTEYLHQSFVYNLQGNLASTTNADGLTTEYTYDLYGNRTGTIQPLPAARATGSEPGDVIDASEWNVFGDLLRQIAPSGVVTSYTYDQLGRVLTATEGEGTDARTIRYRYNAAGNTTQIDYQLSDNSTVSTFTEYDGFGRRTRTHGYGVYEESYSYYADGSLHTITNAKGVVTELTYDAFSRNHQVFEDGVLVATNLYDTSGNLVETIDAEGHHMLFAYDALNRLRYQSVPFLSAEPLPENWWTNFANVSRENTYDRFGALKTVREAHGQLTTNHYDDFGRLKELTTPTGATIEYEYTQADRVRRIKFPAVSTSGSAQGSEILYTYDTVNPGILVSQKSRSGQVTSFQYDDALRQAVVFSPTGAVRAFTYDAFGRLHQEIDYETAADHLADLPYRTTEYTAYDDFDRLRILTLPGGEGTQTMEYDDKGNLLKKAGSNTYPVEYSYDAVGNLKTLTTLYGHADSANASQSVTQWRYDRRGRLEAKIYPDDTEVIYDYYDNNRLRTRTNARNEVTTYTYDAWGNVDLIDYPANPANVADPLGQTNIDFTYVKGRRTGMTDDGGITTWTYHPQTGLPATESCKHFI